MKILHTSDWHIGKKLNGRARICEQSAILSEICDIAENEKIDLVLLSGDVFDTSVPGSEAEELFFKTAFRLASFRRAVVIISGNHDDARRLSASREFAALSNVYVFGGVEAPPKGDDKNAVYAEKTGKNYCVINAEKVGGERLYLGLLPYPSEQNEALAEGTFEQKISARINACFSENAEDLSQILVAHIFMLGGAAGESERDIELGGTRLVDKSLIPEKCVYTALGHLHKRQVISRERNILYSGAIAGYAFDEVGIEKSVTVFEIEDKKVQNLRVLPLKSGKKLVSITACDVLSAKKLLEDYSDCLVKLTLKLEHPLSEKESKELAGNYPALVELVLQIAGRRREDLGDRRALSDRQAFEKYYESRYGAAPPSELLQLYLELMEVEDETAKA